MGQASQPSNAGVLISPVNLTLRPLEWPRDRANLLGLLQEHLSASIDESRLEWLYQRGPHGEATVWLAEEQETGKLAGAAAAFARRLYVGGRIELGCVLGDFCISPEHRSLGPALRLQRKCLESFKEGGFTAGFDLPSASMLAIYRRLGFAPGPELVRMTQLLRTDAKFAARTKSKLLARTLSAVGNAVLSAKRGKLRLRSGASIERHAGRFGGEFSELATRVADRVGNCVERSAEYLNWRYAEHPREKFAVITARRANCLEGYVVFQRRRGRAAVVDCFSGKPEVRKDLVRAVTELAHQEGCEAIDVPVLSAHPFCEELLSLGFRPRESSPVIFLTRSNSKASSTPAATNWLLLDGDREG